jgi:hypothetical protein
MERGRTLRRRSSVTEEKYHDTDMRSPIHSASRYSRGENFILLRSSSESYDAPNNEYESHPCNYDYAMNDSLDGIEDFYGPVLKFGIAVAALIAIFLIAVLVEIIISMIKTLR